MFEFSFSLLLEDFFSSLKSENNTRGKLSCIGDGGSLIDEGYSACAE